jgi:hypothetical protein
MTRTLDIVGKHFSEELSKWPTPADLQDLADKRFDSKTPLSDAEKKRLEDTLADVVQAYEEEKGKEINDSAFYDSVREVRTRFLRTLQGDMRLHAATSDSFYRLVWKI